MQIIKPNKLGLICKTYGLKGHQFSVAALSFFQLGADNVLLTDNSQWPRITQYLSDGTIPDMGFAKPQGEYLLAGKAFAPNKQPVAKMKVAVTLGSHRKQLKIIGDRLWNGLFISPARLTQPFESMPLGYQRAYGGPQFKLNPIGTGVIKRQNRDPESGLYRLPNLYYPNESTFADGAERAVAGFGPLGIDWPQRSKYQGTYNQDWLENIHPGFPNDTKEQIFNAAPQDQQFKGFIKPGECYQLDGMHPEIPSITGKLPSIYARIFIDQLVDGEIQFKALPTVIDTVWFFPELMLGLALHRGVTQVNDSDGLDVKRLMLACEWVDDKPRTLDYYQQLMAVKSTPKKALAQLFNDGQLMPQKTAEQLTGQQQQLAAAKTEQLAKAKNLRDQKLAEISAKYPNFPMPTPELDAELIETPGPIPQSIIDSGDVDLTEHIAYAEAMTAQAKSEQEQRNAELLAKKDELAKQQATQPCESLASMQGRVQSIVFIDAVDLKEDVVQITPEWLKLLSVDESQQAQLMTAAQMMAENTRKARQQAPSVTVLPQPLPENGPLILRGWALQILEAGHSLAGRDLAGIDLSGLDLSGRDLREVMLEKADLSHCDFSHCQLNGAVLTGANLDGAVFDQATMNQVNLSLVKGSKTRFVGANLTQALMSEVQLAGADFSNATLNQAILIKGDMEAANFSAVQISKTHFVEPQLQQSQWAGSQLSKAILLQPQISQTQWQGANLQCCIVVEADAAKADFSGIEANKVQFSNLGNFVGANLANGKWQTCGFRGLDLSGCDGRASLFQGCDFGETQLTGATLSGTLFDGCMMAQATLDNSDCQGAFFHQSRLRKAHIEGADLRNASLENTDISEVKWINCRTRGMTTNPQPSLR